MGNNQIHTYGRKSYILFNTWLGVVWVYDNILSEEQDVLRVSGIDPWSQGAEMRRQIIKKAAAWFVVHPGVDVEWKIFILFMYIKTKTTTKMNSDEYRVLHPDFNAEANKQRIAHYQELATEYFENLSEFEQNIVFFYTEISLHITIGLNVGAAKTPVYSKRSFLQSLYENYQKNPDLQDTAQFVFDTRILTADVLKEEQTSQFAKYLRVYANLLQNILFGAPRLTESVYVWRGIQDNKFLPSGIVSCSARVPSSPSRAPSVKRVSFSSSTTELETAHGEDYTNRDTGCCLEFLHLPPGLPFAYVDKISDYEGEDEVILPLNITFQYLCESGTKIDDNTTVYFVDVIPETPYL